jgi:diacylglycerol kinase
MLSFKRLLKSFGYAGRGLLKVAREEQNFRIELAVLLLVILAAIYLRLSWLEVAMLVLASGLVLIMEIINSAIEAVSDVLKPKLDTYVKRIKDIVAAGVMIAAVTALAVGCLIFGRYFFH